MSIVPWDFQKKKGLAIIVGSTTDCISAHVAMLLGSKRVFSDNLGKTTNSNNNTKKNTTEDEDSNDEVGDINSYGIIYLMGHGSSEKHTINTKTMKYIADELCNAGYNGKPTIYITSCEAADESYGKSICELLQEELDNRDIQCKVKSDFDGLSIIIDNEDTNKIEGHNIKPRSNEDENSANMKQKKFKKEHPYKKKNIHLDDGELKDVNEFKKELIKDLGG